MPTAIPKRVLLGKQTPQRVYDFGEKISQKLETENKDKQALHESSGLISGGKLAQPTLWAVLDMLGIGKEFNSFLLGKFQRGHDVEARAIQFLTNVSIDDQPKYVEKLEANEKTGETYFAVPKGSLIAGAICLQKKGGYRGGTGYIDMAQYNDPTRIYHEIKSSTKMSYDKVAAAGRYKGEVNIEKGIGVPYAHHAIQLAYYCLGDGVNDAYLHYFNADDYRLTTFKINPLDYKEEIDFEIDSIQLAFVEKKLPSFEAFLPYHIAYKKDTYPEWNPLTPDQMMAKLEAEYPEAYKKFMEMELPL